MLGDLGRGTVGRSQERYCWEISGEVLFGDLGRGNVRGSPERYCWRVEIPGGRSAEGVYIPKRCTVTTRMISALRWVAMRAINAVSMGLSIWS